MKYYKYIWEEEDRVTNLLELDDEYFCYRAIFLGEKEAFSTNKISQDDPYFLPEGSFEEVLDELEEISTEEFISTWKKVNKNLTTHLKRIKTTFYKGKRVKARVLCFYPQGVIFDCEEAFNGIGNYEDCLAEFGYKRMYPNQVFELIVSAIDEENLMIQLETSSTYHRNKKT
ncbi:hypothetical protein [Algivirga pacifica]|uniref:S1 motif domain-containing protein n=1 Tax=Algivirga pacifica TaxID=1162670 RepID=A0ABP9DGA0_9BACT